MSDRLLRLSLRSLPREVRRRDGEVILDCAREMVDAGASPVAEAAGIAAAGVRARVVHAAGPASREPWTTALDRLAVPLAVAVTALFAAGAYQGAFMGRWWPTSLVAAAAALAGVALRRRALAVTGWSVLLAVDVYCLVTQHFSGLGGRFSGSIGGLSVDVQAAVLPMLVLGLVAALAQRSDGPRRIVVAAMTAAVAAAWVGAHLGGAAAPWRDHHEVTVVLAALLLTPLVLAARAAVVRRPEAMASAALLLAVSAPELVWVSTGLVADPALVVMGAGAALSAFAIVRLARGASMRAQ